MSLIVFQKTESIILHAPNIHSGGGLVLLKTFLTIPRLLIKSAQLDQRTKEKLQLPTKIMTHYVNRSAFSRLCAEWRLWRYTTANDVVLCFHGLPPLFPLRGHVVVFLQNRILVSQSKITGYSLRTKIRLQMERSMLRIFSNHADKFIVQTPSMARDTSIMLGNKINLTILAFSANTDNSSHTFPKQFDFVYIASDDFHKNHTILLEAWHLLANSGQKPSLALTIPPKSKLADKIEYFKKKYHLNISNLGTLDRPEIHHLYQSSSALIFPSTSESLGLPLIEASQCGLPILAPERDYVRDVVNPVQTFDPSSPVSIARAVKRFMGVAESALEIKTAEDFLAEVLK